MYSSVCHSPYSAAPLALLLLLLSLTGLSRSSCRTLRLSSRSQASAVFSSRTHVRGNTGWPSTKPTIVLVLRGCTTSFRLRCFSITYSGWFFSLLACVGTFSVISFASSAISSSFSMFADFCTRLENSSLDSVRSGCSAPTGHGRTCFSKFESGFIKSLSHSLSVRCRPDSDQWRAYRRVTSLHAPQLNAKTYRSVRLSCALSGLSMDPSESRIGTHRSHFVRSTVSTSIHAIGPCALSYGSPLLCVLFLLLEWPLCCCC